MMTRYRSAARKVQIAIAVGVAFGLCVLCSGLSAAIGSIGPAPHATATSGKVVRQATTQTKGRATSPAGVETATPQPNVTATAQPTATRALPTATPRPTATQARPTATPQPTAPPAPPRPPTATPAPACVGVNGNPWCYDFRPGNLIYNPPGTFCNYFNCIPNFWKSTNGYVAECNDQTFSHSGGVQGACSHHRGEWRPLHSH